MEIKDKKQETILEVRPVLHCPEIDPYDNISLEQVIGVENNKTSLEIWDKISYIV